MLPTPVAWSAGVDYLRLTHRRGSDDQYVRNAYPTAAERAAAIACPLGVGSEPWQWMGYRGERMGSCAWGEHAQGYILQASGLGAWALSGIRVAYTNVPRIDIQITCWYESEQPQVARTVANMAVSGRGRRRGKPSSVRFIDGYGDGDTCYIGRRGKRSKFLRVYDKWAESGREPDYRHAWRFEAELTDEHAALCWGSVQDLGRGENAVAGLVRGYMADRGVELPELSGVPLVEPEKLPRDEGSDARRLRWLREQVRPAIDKMRARGVAVDDIVSALGLTRDDILRGYLHGA